MKKRTGKYSYRGRPSELLSLFQRRRSVRKYAEGSATESQLAIVLECARSFASRAGFDKSRLELVARGPAFSSVIKAAMAGLVGKINPWLVNTKASHLLLCGARYQDHDPPAEIERSLKETAMTTQVAILAATELGLASCWLAGINHQRIEMSYALSDGARLCAMSPLGIAPQRMGISFDALSYHLISKRRKALSSIWMVESWGIQASPEMPPLEDDSQPELLASDEAGESTAELISTLTGKLPRCDSPAESGSSATPGPAELLAIMEAVRLAPSADNAQTWRLIEVRTERNKQALAKAVPPDLRDSFAQSALILVVCGEPWLLKRTRREQPFVMLDVPIGLTHLLYQSLELELQPLWTLQVDEPATRAVLAIPEKVRVVALVAF